MKAFVLFITAIFIAGLVNLFTPKPMPHNEVESVNNICAISKIRFACISYCSNGNVAICVFCFSIY